MNRIALAASLLLTFAALAEEDAPVAVAKGCKDSAVVTRFPGSRLEQCYRFVWSEHVVQTGPQESPSPRVVAGGYEQLIYAMAPRQSALEVVRNFQKALEAAGFAVEHQSGARDRRALTASKAGSGTGKQYVSVTTADTSGRIWATLTFLQEAPLPMRLATKAGPPAGKKDNKTCKEPKALPRMAGSTLHACEVASGTYQVQVSADGRRAPLDGDLFEATYRQDPTTSESELVRTYEAHFKAQGYVAVVKRGAPKDTSYTPVRYELTVHDARNKQVNVALSTDTMDADVVALEARVVEGKEVKAKDAGAVPASAPQK